MTMPELDAAEFAPIRADLARLYLAHRAELGLSAESACRQKSKKWRRASVTFAQWAYMSAR
jgi:hypothetical protein